MPIAQKSRKRLPRTERERLILEEAVRFFAETGFEGQTRALAQRLGVTQPLLYRYFPDKDSLIERVFDEVYLKRWNPEWEEMLRDRTQPLADRLCEFYKAYSKAIYKSEFVRIFMYAGLRDERINKRYLDLVRQHIFLPVCREFRNELGLPEIPDEQIDETGMNVAWSLHGLVAQFAIRRWVYGLESANGPENNPEDNLDLPIRAFVLGVLSLQKAAT